MPYYKLTGVTIEIDTIAAAQKTFKVDAEILVPSDRWDENYDFDAGQGCFEVIFSAAFGFNQPLILLCNP